MWGSFMKAISAFCSSVELHDLVTILFSLGILCITQ